MIVIIITYVFSYVRTETPRLNGIPVIIEDSQDIIKDDYVIIPPINNISFINNDKYKIINRSFAIPEDITNKKKVVLLTIDDGPSKRTKEIMTILNNHNAKAIFFINGVNDKNNIGIIQEIYREGFAVGNHTWDHLNLKKQSDTKIIENEINKTTNLIKEITGVSPLFFRAPYGESNSYIRKLVADDGMIFMDWSGSVKDWEKSTIEKDVFVNNAILNLRSGSILLIHEHPWSLANLDALLTALEERGYSYLDPNNIIE